MDRPIAEHTQNKQRNIKLLKWGGLVLVLVSLFFGFRSLLTTDINRDKIRIATVERGEVESTILASGIVAPLYEMVLNAPIEAEIKRVKVRTGGKVNTGDTLLELDATFIKLQYDQLKDQLELKKNNVGLLRLQYQKELKDLAIENNMQELKLSRLQSSLKDAQKLDSIGGITGEEVKQAQMNVQIAELEKEKLREELKYKKDALTGNLRNLELEVRIQEKKLAELVQKIELSNIKPIQPGVVTWINQSLGEKVQAGDPLAKVANLKHFKVDAQITDRHMNKLIAGMPLRVRINKTFLDGRITTILPEIKQNKISFGIALENDSNEVLRPSMQVEVIIPTEKKMDVLRVTNGAAFTGSKDQEIFVVYDQQVEKRKIKLGLTNGDYVELIGDIKEGDQVIISNTAEFKHRTTFQLETK